MIFKLREKAIRNYLGLGFQIQTPHEYYETIPEYQKNVVNIVIGKYSWWFDVPMLIKPKRVFKENQRGSEKFEGKTGYWDNIQRMYGFSTVPDSGIHTYYGIQPGEWHSKNPEKSDHVKIFNYFWNWHHVRHDAYDVDGNYLCDGRHFQEWEFAYLPKYTKPFNKETKNTDFQTVPHFVFPKSNKAASQHRPFMGKYDNFSNISSNVKVFEFFKFIDPFDKSETVARCNIEEREWIRGSWSWLRAILKYVPGCRKIQRSIDIEFRDEVGGGKTGWKGGTLGMGFEMLPDESIENAFKRLIKDEYQIDRFKRER